MKLSVNQNGLLKLIGRSPVKEDGWRGVSEVCCQFFDTSKEGCLPAELYEFEKLEVGGRVRFTDKGETLLAYS